MATIGTGLLTPMDKKELTGLIENDSHLLVHAALFTAYFAPPFGSFLISLDPRIRGFRGV
ncbi:MAG TPA: hypothetical protein VE242_08680 [Chthoniobacterales bacterium]|nr:hypothetical protein [Chthoniobacterales bacterium]